MNQEAVIAIDGPAASGKSTVARKVAERFGFLYVNSGAMYRAVTWSVLRAGIDPSDEAAVVAHLEKLAIQTAAQGGWATITVDGEDPGSGLVAEKVNLAVSAVSRIGPVRERLVAEQRLFAQLGGLVMEGRDIGTVVFPETRYKFFLDASEEVREARRRAQGIEDDLAARDRQDSSRKIAPLKIAEDATVVDTSNLSIDGVVEFIARNLEENGLKLAAGD